MLRRDVIAVALAVVAVAAGPALGDETYHVDGEADAGGTDPRVAALDVAFAAATREALADLVAPADLKAHKADLDREVVGRARKWVASYKVTSEVTAGDVRKLVVDVKIAVDKLTARLGELGVAVVADSGGDGAVPDPTAVAGAGRGKKATVLLRVDTPRSVIASYGAAAERDVPGLASLTAAVRAAGWQPVSAPASGPAARQGDELLGDDSARALAGSAGADLAVVVGVYVDASGEVRGTSEHGALARARVRVLDRAGGLVGDGTALGGAHGTDDGAMAAAAIATASVDAFADARPAGSSTGAGPVAAVTAGTDEVLIEITARDKRDAPPWSMVRAIRDKLAGGKGVRVSIRRLAAREVVLGVSGGGRGADKLARDIRDLEHKISDTSFATKVAGNVVEVRVSGSP